MKFRIRARYSGSILFELNTKSLKLCVEAAVSGGAYLRGADLGGADLRGAYLRGADLRGAYLGGADLRGAYLGGAYLRGAYLGGAYLRGAYLGGAYLRGAEGLAFSVIARLSICPRSGSFIAWKKGYNGSIIKLKIPSWARRVSPIVGRKCRAEFAIVLAIYDSNGKPIESCGGWRNSGEFKYRVGDIVKPDWYDATHFEECSHGIHFFVTEQEAEDWG